MLFYECVSVKGEWWAWLISRILLTWKNIFNKFCTCYKYIFWHILWHEKIYLNTMEYFSTSPRCPCGQAYDVQWPQTPTIQGSMFNFWWELMGRFANRFCDCWNKSSYFDLMSHFAICKCYKVTSPMQVVQYTLNRYHDNNKYKNRIDI
jgi:hypothetical protein